MRRRTKIGIGLPAILLLILAGVVLMLPRIDLASFAAARLSASLGREVTIGSLRVKPGATTRVVLREGRLANIEGGSRPVMAEVALVEATLAPLPLLWGEIALEDVSAEGFKLLLERTRDRRRNWRFHEDPTVDQPTTPTPTATQSTPPLPATLRLTSSEIVVRTTGGQSLTTRIEDGTLTVPETERATIQARGSYNEVPLRLEGTLPTRADLAAGGAMPLTLRATARDTSLLYDGTATDIFSFDGLDGRITFAATTPRDVLAIAGVKEAGPSFPVELAGRLTRQGDLWRLRGARGKVDGQGVEVALLELNEGAAGQPDVIRTQMAFERLDLDSLLGTAGAQEGQQQDQELSVPANPDPVIHAEIAAREFTTEFISGRDAQVKLEIVPRRIALEAHVTAMGGRINLAGQMVPAGNGARATVSMRMRGADIDAVRRQLGTHALPIAGPVDVDLVVGAEGRTFAAALEGAHIAAVVQMDGGTITQEVVEMASTDIRALFRPSQGHTPITCLLAAVEVRGGQGQAAPLRIRAGTGTIAGLATFDLNRKTMDLVIGSERATTDFFALDIPVRVHGSFADPNIAPAEWSSEGRERLAQGGIAPLPEGLLEIAQRSPCHAGRTIRR